MFYLVRFVTKYGAICIVNFLFIGCVSLSTVRYDEDRETAIQATKQFHQLLNENRFEEIFELTDERARRTKSKDALISILTTLRKEQGSVLRSDLKDSEIQVRSTYREVHLKLNTTFENETVVEIFVWYVANNKASLFSYAIE